MSFYKICLLSLFFNAFIIFMKRSNQTPLVSFFLWLILCFSISMPGLKASDSRLSPRETICFEDVVQKARCLAEKSYLQPDRNSVPEALRRIDYEKWQDIRFNPAKSLWAEDSFFMQFFHRGFLFQEPVTVNSVDKNGIQRIPFFPDLFKYKNDKEISQLQGDLGFSGFRIHYPSFKRTDFPNELVAFLGASYFRALGKKLVYGLSARGLAVNPVESVGEEFPRFTEFWVVRPSFFERKITVYGLLDSVSLTGAYEFVICPGETTVMYVKNTLFIRKAILKLGVAPLTSMFWFGECYTEKRKKDFRSEVHDSDGISIQASSEEWIWHPLVNPKCLQIDLFSGGQPLGFGLMQRDTNFDHYLDLQANYDRRPSAWISPQGDWGKGHVELFQLPTGTEYCDNIGAYWVPQKSPEPGETLSYAYTLSWCSASKKRPPFAFVDSTRFSREDDRIMFVVDFLPEGKQKRLSAKNLTAEIQPLNGYRISGSQVIENPRTGGLRLVIHVRFDQEGFLSGVVPNELPALRLSAFIKDKKGPVTETWSYTYQP